MPAPKVFITYRREETAAHAGRLYDAMVARFGEGNAFMDVDMAPGVDFVERITEAVAGCQVLLVIMGPSWATVEDERGRARLADPEDFVRLEVETALARPEVTPIPVLVAGARMPKREDLPPEVQAITRRNALELSDQRWLYDVGRLMRTLDELLGEAPLVPGPPLRERDVAAGKTAPGGAARAPGETPPPSMAAVTTPPETKPEARPAADRWRLRWALLGAIAIIAIVLAIVVAVGGDGSSTQPDGGGSSKGAAPFSGTDLPDLVLPGTDAPGNLLFNSGKSGYVRNPEEGLEDLGGPPLPSNTQASYHKVFEASYSGAEPYDYSESVAAVFPDEDGAQGALDGLKGEYQGEEIEEVPAQGLGEDRFAVLVTHPANPGPEYLYAWRTGNLLQVFDLVWSREPASEPDSRGFADTMDGLADRVS